MSADLDLPEFLPELAHYEWVELALDTSDEDRELPAHDPDGELLTGQPLINPVLRVLAYQWPVHRLAPRYRPKEPPPEATFLLAHRDGNLRVVFTVINPLTARLLALLQEQPQLTGQAALSLLAQEIGSESNALERHGAGLLANLRDQGAILGTRL